MAPVVLPLRTWRVRHGWTQRDLAAQAGVSLTTVRAIEAGRRVRVHPGNRMRLATALGVTVADIREIANGDPEHDRPSGARPDGD